MNKKEFLEKYREELKFSIWGNELEIKYYERKKIKYAHSPQLTNIANAITELKSRISIAQEKIDLAGEFLKDMKDEEKDIKKLKKLKVK